MVTALAVLFVFGLLIIGHEFGHFIIAKISGVKVMEFSFGMGPALLKFGKGETEYAWRAFPIGGFVRMLGEEEEDNDPRSFSMKPTPVKMAIIAAGPIMNMIIAIIIFAIISMSAGYLKPVVSDYAKPVKIEDVETYPAKEAGVMVGDKIVKANGKTIHIYDDFLMFMMKNGGTPFDLTVNRGGKDVDLKVNPVYSKEDGRYLVGIMVTPEKAGLLEGLQYGALKSWTLVKEMGGFFKDLAAGKASSDDVSGPVGIIKITGDVAHQGFGSLLMFTAFLSVNLAVMNLIPFPALDGGWLLILIIEGIRRKKLDPDKIGVLNFIGFAFLMILVVIVTFKDVARLNIF
jgi:regulator of sigma E protease